MRLRVAWLALMLALLWAAWHYGAFETFGDADKVHALLGRWGTWAYVLYVASFAVLMPMGIPAFVWVLPAGILWPFWVAYPLSLAGVAGGASLGYLFARYIGRDWVGRHIPPRVRRFDELFAVRGLRSVILFRLVFQLGAPTHWLLGLSRVGYGTFLAGTLIGAMPVVALVTWFGHDAFHWVQTHATLAWILLALIVAAAIVVRRVLLARRV